MSPENVVTAARVNLHVVALGKVEVAMAGTEKCLPDF
jgi:hypothetical protein